MGKEDKETDDKGIHDKGREEIEKKEKRGEIDKEKEENEMR